MDGSDAVRWQARRQDGLIGKVLEETGNQCRVIARQFGFGAFHVLIRTVAPPGIPLQLAVDGAPCGFQDLHKAHVDGPGAVLQKAMDVTLPLALTALDPLGAEMAAGLVEQCARLGIVDGVVIPLHGPRSSRGLIMLMSAAPLAAAADERERLHRDLYWLALQMFSRSIDDIARAWEKNKRKQLSTRQLQALRLAGRGKSMAAIAEAMGVHPSTARYLVSRAIDKLGVQTRMEAVLRNAALSDFDSSTVADSTSGWGSSLVTESFDGPRGTYVPHR